MSYPDPPTERPARPAFLRELIGLLLLVLGVAGLDTVLFFAHPLAGWGFACAVVAAVGAWLTVGEV